MRRRDYCTVAVRQHQSCSGAVTHQLRTSDCPTRGICSRFMLFFHKEVLCARLAQNRTPPVAKVSSAPALYYRHTKPREREREKERERERESLLRAPIAEHALRGI